MKKITLLFLLFSTFLFGQINILTTDFTVGGASFSLVFTDNEVVGTLTSIDIDATLAASTADTYANDLMIFITATSDINSSGILQAGGFSNFGAAEKIEWTTGGSAVIGTQVLESQNLATPLDFSANPTYNIWLGNGYVNANPPTNSGTWNDIDIALNGVSQAPLSTDIETENTYSIYPNPAKNFVSISNTDTSLEITSLGIIDINGRAIKTVVFGNTSNNSQVNISDLSSGIYTFVISSNKGISVKKFVKQ